MRKYTCKRKILSARVSGRICAGERASDRACSDSLFLTHTCTSIIKKQMYNGWQAILFLRYSHLKVCWIFLLLLLLLSAHFFYFLSFSFNQMCLCIQIPNFCYAVFAGCFNFVTFIEWNFMCRMFLFQERFQKIERKKKMMIIRILCHRTFFCF